MPENIGFYCNCSKYHFVDDMLALKKRDETRGRDTLKGIIGKTVYIIETGKGRPLVRGTAFVAGMRRISFSDIAARKEAGIYKTAFDILPGKTKCFYRLENVKPLEKPFFLPENRVNHGRAWTEF